MTYKGFSGPCRDKNKDNHVIMAQVDASVPLDQCPVFHVDEITPVAVMAYDPDKPHTVLRIPIEDVKFFGIEEQL